ncbi:hypothetical protein [Treponema bryantii]|uniref:hypothetical protein n=1 Tax=Treponema bryantii TaxID=163 RepID=UPI002B2FA859|nr:hypothetical protein TRBR_21010 [Treponema bryantii]
MKKTSLIFVSMMLFAGSLFAAPKKNAAPVEPISVTFSESTRWGTDATLADGVYGEDGSVTYTAMYRYGGGGYTFNINGKTGINLKDYSSCEIEFEYKTGSWEKPEVMPKFGIKYFGSGATFFNGGQPLDWVDAEEPSGTITRTIDLTGKSGKAVRIGVLANSWQWAGNGNGNDKGDDTVIITVKKITFLP